jgi:uncharacterized repeat protein (TIGR01451 family)
VICDDGTPFDPALNGVTLTLDPGEVVHCTFVNTDQRTKPTIMVTKTAQPTTVGEPGGQVVYTVQVKNTGSTAVTVTSLTDSIHGDLDGQGTCDVPQAIAVGGAYLCTFSATVSGNAGYSETDVVTASARDEFGNETTGEDGATVTITDVKPTITLDKSANPTSVLFTGGAVTYTAKVTNTSPEPVTLTSLADDKFGNLNGQGTCTLPQTIAVGGSYTCTLTKSLTGQYNANGLGFKPHLNTVTATANDDEGNTASAKDDATVTFFWRGRTPGYWRNHATGWPAPYAPNQTVQSVFAIPSCLKSSSGNLDLSSPKGADTLIQALSYPGGSSFKGKAQILLRAAVAGILNEQFFGATYPPYGSTAQLIQVVNSTLATCNGTSFINLAGQLDFWNNGVH